VLFGQLPDFILAESHDAPVVIHDDGRKGFPRIPAGDRRISLPAFLAFEQIDIDIIVSEAKLLEQALRFFAPGAGAQGVKNDPMGFVAINMGEMYHEGYPFRRGFCEECSGLRARTGKRKCMPFQVKNRIAGAVENPFRHEAVIFPATKE
jgi:hypothetical protein